MLWFDTRLVVGLLPWVAMPCAIGAGMDCDWSNNVAAEANYDSLRAIVDGDFLGQVQMGNALIEEGLLLDDCRRWMAGMTLVMSADPYGEYEFVEMDDCPWQFGRFYYQKGVHEYLQQNFESALQSFDHALQSDFDETMAYTGMGACQFEQSQYPEALRLFTAAWIKVESPGSEHIMLLNNLASISNIIGEFDEALKWADEADAVLKKAELNSTDQSWYAARILYNRWSARCLSGDTAFVKQNLIELPWGSPDLGPGDWLDLYAKTLHCVPDLKFALRYHSTARQWSETLEDDFLANRLGYLSMAYTPEWDSLSHSLSRANAFSWLLGLGPAMRPGTPPTSHSDKSMRGIDFVKFAASMVLWLVATGMLIRHLVQRKGDDGALETGIQSKDWVQLKEMAQSETTPDAAKEILSELIGNYTPLAPETEDEVENLLISERVVFQADLRAESPKVTARKNNWSPAYVYFLRTKVRGKLGRLPSDSTES